MDTEALVREKLTKIHEPGFAEAFAKIMQTMGSPANRDHYAVIHRLPYMRLPVLVLIGERDKAAMDLKDQVAAALTDSSELRFIASVRFIASGHRMHLEDPQLFASTVREYLNK